MACEPCGKRTFSQGNFVVTVELQFGPVHVAETEGLKCFSFQVREITYGKLVWLLGIFGKQRFPIIGTFQWHRKNHT